tara:strand:- start:2512 stop:3144 length:633 start_codon:yes stop_codon:yes gene_type:complete
VDRRLDGDTSAKLGIPNHGRSCVEHHREDEPTHKGREEWRLPPGNTAQPVEQQNIDELGDRHRTGERCRDGIGRNLLLEVRDESFPHRPENSAPKGDPGQQRRRQGQGGAIAAAGEVEHEEKQRENKEAPIDPAGRIEQRIDIPERMKLGNGNIPEMEAEKKDRTERDDRQDEADKRGQEPRHRPRPAYRHTIHSPIKHDLRPQTSGGGV